MHIVLAGGGTGGHIEPALVLAAALRRRDPDVGITMLGTQRGLETRLVPAAGFDLRLIPPVPLPRRLTPSLLSVPNRMRGAVNAAAAVLREVRADVVVGFGGYVALPAYFAARRLKVPIVVHEANAKAGLANRVGARFATAVATATPTSKLPHAVHIGVPLRRTIATLDRSASRGAGLAAFGLTAGKPTLLVFGGSQGARTLNDAIPPAAQALLGAGAQVLHAAGPKHEQAVTAAVASLAGENTAAYHVVPYIERMDLAYAAADLAVSRAGAMTCAELAAVGLPAVYVPLPQRGAEQRFNAEPVVAAGGGLSIPDGDFGAQAVTDVVLPLLADAGRLATMSAAAAAFGQRDADEKLADMVEVAARNR